MVVYQKRTRHRSYVSLGCMLFLGHRLSNGSPYAIRPLSVCPVLSVLSATLVYCGQTVGRIKMKLSIQVGLGPGHILLDGDPAPPPPKRHSPQFSARICCGQMTGWLKKMSLGMEVGLGSGDFVLYGDPAPSSKRGRSPPIFGPYLLLPTA